jgi:Flp pilus assembly protein CpaB
MELEYKDDRRRGRFIIFAGIVLALVAAGFVYFAINRAQEESGQAGVQRIAAVVAVAAIPARQPITDTDVTVRQVPIDETNANGVIADPNLVVGRIAAVTILQGQLVTSNLLASATEGGGFSILGPSETVGPDSVAWRAISLTVPDDLAVGGTLTAGDTVDVFVTAVVNINDPSGKYIADRSTKITYQDVVILSRKDAFYIIRAPVEMAEEIAHLQATGSATFSFALRPIEDQRLVDASSLGETTNRIIERYGLPIPVAIVPGYTAAPTRAPEPSPSPEASASPKASAETSPASSPAASPAP